LRKKTTNLLIANPFSVVKENMDDFGMSREEAVEDAIKQFEMQVQAPTLLSTFHAMNVLAGCRSQ